jgi:hypothetical protein
MVSRSTDGFPSENLPYSMSEAREQHIRYSHKLHQIKILFILVFIFTIPRVLKESLNSISFDQIDSNEKNIKIYTI